MDGTYPYTSRVTGELHYVSAEHCRGVYLIRNIATLQVYIGATLQSMARRWTEHQRALDRNGHTCRALQGDWVRYGSDLFEFEVLDVIDDSTELRSAEQSWIDRYREHGLALYNRHPKSNYPAADIVAKTRRYCSLVCRVAAHRARKQP